MSWRSWRTLLGLISCGLLLALAAGTAMASYRSLLFIALGILLGSSSVVVATYLRESLHVLARLLRTVLPLLVALAAALSLMMYYVGDFSLKRLRLPEPLLVSEYTARIAPQGDGLRAFHLTEEVVLRPESSQGPPGDPALPSVLTQPSRTVETRARGVFINEVRWDLAEVDMSGHRGGQSQGALEGFAFIYSGARARVQISRLLTGTFYAAANSSSLARSTYFDTETITWDLVNPTEGIAFAFVTPPFQAMTPLLVPFMQITSWPSAVIGASFVLASTLVVLILKPLLTDYLKKLLNRVVSTRR